MENTSRFSQQTEQALRAAGWFPNRALSDEELAKWYVVPWEDELGHSYIFPAALKVLREFGNLKIESIDNEQGIPLESVIFDPLQMELPPALGTVFLYGWYLEDIFFPIGSYFQLGNVADSLAINTRGQIFMLSEHAGFVAENIDVALEQFVLSIRPGQYRIIEPPDSAARFGEARRITESIQERFASIDQDSEADEEDVLN